MRDDEQETRVSRPAPDLLAKIFDTFLHTDLMLDDLAIDFGINRLVLADIAKEGKWLARKKALELELYQSAEAKFRQWLIVNKLPTLTRHMEASAALENEILQEVKALAQDKTPGKERIMKLKHLADALSTTTQVSARAAGISDVPFPDEVAMHQGKQKQPLVIINAGPQVPVSVEMKNITEQQ